MRPGVRKRGETHTAYWFVRDPEGKRVQRSKGGFKTETAAYKHRIRQLAAIGDGSYHEPVDAKIRTAAFLRDVWLPVVRTGATKSGEPRRASTINSYEIAVEHWIVPYIGGERLVALTPRHIENMVSALAEHGGRNGRPLSGRSCQYAHGALRMALDYAVRTGYVQRNVAALVGRPGAKSRQMTAWSAEQAQTFLAAAESDRLYAAYVLYLARGPRRGELAGLRWQDVDLVAGTARLVHTHVIVETSVVCSTPKTDAGRRTLHLDPGLLAVLRAHRKRQVAERLAAGEAWTEDACVCVFTDELGRAVHPAHISDRFQALARRAGVPVIRLHDARHTAATLMLAGGVPVKVAAEMLGHSSPAITPTTYQHVLPGMAEEAGGKLTGMLGLGISS